MFTLSIKKYIAILTSPFNITFGSINITFGSIFSF